MAVDKDKTVDAKVYQDALKTFMDTLGIDSTTAFAVDVQADKTVAKHVEYVIKDNGVHSGDFWNEVITRGDSGPKK